MKFPYLVSSCRQAFSLLRQPEALRGEEAHLFPGGYDLNSVMSENTINKALRVMGYDTMVIAV